MALFDLNVSNGALRTREEIVADTIRAAILRGTFKPGEKLDQQELADSLGVSRSPIREALRTLAAEDLVTNMPHRGASVTERTQAELEELMFIRVLLEGAAAERAANVIDDSQLAKLAQILQQADCSADHKELLTLNNAFHTTIYESYPQPIIVKEIQQLRNKVAPYNRLYLGVEGRKAAAWADHRRIYEACVQRDGAAARCETEAHLHQVFEGILAALG